MTLRIRDVVEMGDYVLLVEGNPSPVRVYRHHFGTVTKVERRWDGQLVASEKATLPTPVIEAVIELFRD